MKSNNQMKSTISNVVKHDLCTGCGTCITLCPNEAIELKINEKKGIYVPELHEKKCNNCGICSKVCPGHEVDFSQLNFEIFGKGPEDVLIGNYLNCYLGHAIDYNIRYNSASGGLITALLIFALEEGLIDGALVTRMKKEMPLESEPFIARTREDIIEAKGSKYCPVPANIALREILDAKEGERFAVVGLPCHINGLRKAQRVNAKLKERIVMCFGIFCSHNDSFLATEYISNWFGIDIKDVKNIEYRGRGWPGSMLIELNDGNKKVIPYKEQNFVHLLQMFNPVRCTMCHDGLSELSDISFGDAWRIELNDEIGTSLCIARTDIGDKLIQHAVSAGAIKLKKIDKSTIIGSQGLLSYGRIRNAKVNMFFAKLCGKAYPEYYNKEIYSGKLFNPRFSDYIKFILLGLHKKVMSKKMFWKGSKSIFLLELKLVRNILKK